MKNPMFARHLQQYELENFVREYCVKHEIPFVQVHDSFTVEDKYSKQITKAVEEFTNQHYKKYENMDLENQSV
jgi:hypothetical protein